MKQHNDYYIAREYRALELRAEQREENGESIIFGRPAIYGQETFIGTPDGGFLEEIKPGAFVAAALKDVRLFVNHDDRGITLARSRNNNENSTMQIGIDEEGLYFEAKLDTENNAQARALYSAIGRGDMSGMSFAFFVPVDGQEWETLEDGTAKRTITKIEQVDEISVVNFPAYAGTSINKRSLESDAAALDRAAKALESAEIQRLKIENLRKANRIC